MKNTVKKRAAVLLDVMFCLSLLASCGNNATQETGSPSSPSVPNSPVVSDPLPSESTPSEQEPSAQVGGLLDLNEYLWEISGDADLETKLKLEFRNFTIVRALQNFFTEESYKAYNSAYLKMKKNGTEELFEQTVALRNELVQTDAIGDCVWYIWGKNTPGPVVDGEEYTEEDLDASLVDSYGFTPLLIKYLLDDPTSAKGNVIVVAGGGYSRRTNTYEGWPVCEKFNEMGYNAFLLQRRVEPYSTTDIHMDLQRAIRIVRYYGEQEGYGGMDMIAAAGFSGGGMTILGQINECYGTLTPQVYDSDYMPDEIDAVDSDLDVAMIVYGAFGQSLNEDNKNWPAMFFSCGTEDEMGAYENTLNLYESIRDKAVSTLNLIEGAKHGYGYGGSETPAYAPGAENWMELADAFMQQNR